MTLFDSKSEFYRTNNIDPEKLSWLGKGDFGDAYSIGDGRVLKKTTSKKEFSIAAELVGRNIPHLANIYATGEVKLWNYPSQYYIIMEELEEDSSIEDMFYELMNIVEEQGGSFEYLGNIDFSELDLSDEMIEFIDAIETIYRMCHNNGVYQPDVKPENLGRDKNGVIKMFDIDSHDRRMEESVRKMIREEILNERLNEIDSDVNLLYDEYFKESIDSIQRGDLITYNTFKKNVSNTLYLNSEDAKKAHQLNPCPIQINYSSNFYNPHQNIISIGIHQEAFRLVLESKGSIENAADMLRNQKQRNSFLQEFTEEKIKGSIHHELLHWIDDTFNNRHIRKTTMRANELGTKDINGIPVNSTKLEIQGQMGNLKQLYNKFTKLNRLDDWNNLSFMDLTNLLPTLSTIYNELKGETRDNWIRNLRTRMHREGILGDNMKYLNESLDTLISIKKIIREELGFIFKDVINESVKSEVKLSDLYVEDDNILDAYFKAKNNLGPSSRSTGKPLAVTKLLDGSLILMDGHHRVIDRIKYLGADNIDDILNLRFDAIITSENYEDLDEYPDGEYWIPLFDWIYDMEEKLIGEDINIPVEIGDEILTGKFKNKRTVVKNIDKNDKGDVTINDKPALKFRIPEKIKEGASNNIICKSCGWEWAVESNDKNPHLCHKCGYDNQKNEFDNVSLEAWKKENNIK